MFAVQLAVAIGLLSFVFRDAELRARVWAALAGARPSALLWSVAAAGVGIAANIWRWALFLRVFGVEERPPRLAAVFLIGMAFNLVGFGSFGGDAARAVLLMRSHPDKKRAIVLSIVADHFSGIVAMAVSASVFGATRYSWFMASKEGAAALTFIALFSAVSLAVFVLAVLAVLDRERRLLPDWLPARPAFVALANQFTPFAEHPGQTVRACLVAFPVLYGHFLSYSFAAQAFGAPVGAGEIFAIMPVVEGVTALPITVAGLGVREGLFEVLLGAMAGTPAELAVLISLAGFACSTLVWSALGAALIPFRNGRR